MGTVRVISGHRVYPRKSRWLARGFLFIFAGVTVAFVALGQLWGVSQVKDGMQSVADSPTALINVFRDLQSPTSTVLSDAAVHVVQASLADIRRSVTGAPVASPFTCSTAPAVDGRFLSVSHQPPRSNREL